VMTMLNEESRRKLKEIGVDIESWNKGGEG